MKGVIPVTSGLVIVMTWNVESIVAAFWQSDSNLEGSLMSPPKVSLGYKPLILLL